MRILHWNIHGWVDADGVDNVDRVIEVIRNAAPDVVSLVEVDEPWGDPIKLREVAEALGYHWAFVPAFEYREAGGFGNALLANRPLTAVQQWQLLPPMLYDGTERSEPRAVVVAQVDTAFGVVGVGSTHFPRSDGARRKHAGGRLLDVCQNLTDPFVICGDFNQQASSWVPASIAVAPSVPVATYPTARPEEPIDYCLSSGLTIDDCMTIDTDASDHLPILAAGASV